MNEPRNRFPFTPSQWQELEHQALIFKYMASGISIPPDLLFSIRTTSFDSPLSSRLLPHHHQHSFGWNYLQMGLGRKIDAEPGRCRRTDGKKWRCSKEAFPNSKYCERHMHRGNHRFRKPLPQQPPLKTPSTTTSSSTHTKNNISPSLSLLPSHSFLYHHPHQPNSTSYSSSLLQQHTASPPLNHRYVYDGLKEEVDEHAFFTEPSGAMRSFSASSMDDSSWYLTPLTMSSSSSSKSNHYSNYLQLQNDDNNLSSINAKQAEAETETEQDQGCYMLGLGKLKEPQNQKTIHRFFDDNSWLDMEDKTSTTQLSISIPTSGPPPPHHFPAFNSRTLRDA